MPISINVIACLECSCHIWVPQLIYFDKIHTFPFFSLSQMRKATHFMVLGHNFHFWCIVPGFARTSHMFPLFSPHHRATLSLQMIILCQMVITLLVFLTQTINESFVASKVSNIVFQEAQRRTCGLRSLLCTLEKFCSRIRYAGFMPCVVMSMRSLLMIIYAPASGSKDRMVACMVW
jgi:hypothetical protein